MSDYPDLRLPPRSWFTTYDVRLSNDLDLKVKLIQLIQSYMKSYYFKNYYVLILMQDLRFSQQCCWGFHSSAAEVSSRGMWKCQTVPDVLQNRTAVIITRLSSTMTTMWLFNISGTNCSMTRHNILRHFLSWDQMPAKIVRSALDIRQPYFSTSVDGK